ncbi:UNVERIFIED_CONTAM: hypothetical protein O8I53_11385 [Campylobacter lari]
MNFVTASLKNNSKFYVTETALEELINNAISDTKGVKLIYKPRIIFEQDHSNVEFVIDVKIKKSLSLKDGIDNIKNEIERQYMALLDIKPSSIRICFVGYY